MAFSLIGILTITHLSATGVRRWMQRDLERVKGIRESNSVTEHEYEEHRTLVLRHQEQLNMRKAELLRQQSDAAMSRLEGQADLASAEANLLKARREIQIESLTAELAVATSRLEQTIVTAPIGGQILKVFTFPGEKIHLGPILQMGDTNRMYAVAEVYETDVRFVKVGQRARISSPALAEDLYGTVEQIGLRIYRNEIFSTDPTQKLDARVVEVRIPLDDSKLALRMIYLQVDVEIDVVLRSQKLVLQ